METSRKEVLMTVYTDVEGICHIQNLPHHAFISEESIRVGIVATKEKKIAIQVPIDAVCGFNREQTKANLLLDELLVNHYT